MTANGRIVDELTDHLQGCVVVAHNATCEEGFLHAELARVGVKLTALPTLRTCG